MKQIVMQRKAFRHRRCDNCGKEIEAGEACFSVKRNHGRVKRLCWRCGLAQKDPKILGKDNKKIDK